MADGIILASDRGPVTFTQADAGLTVHRRPGSVTAMLDAAARSIPTRTCWVALSASVADQAALDIGAFTQQEAALGYRFEPVIVGTAEYDAYYFEAGARLLWMAHHGLWDEVAGRQPGSQPPAPPDPRAFTGAYQRVNRRVAEKICSQAAADTLVLLHDYQLATAAGFIRAARPRQPTAFFLHTPFADPAAFARLPGDAGRLLLAGMLGADLLGFQCQEWAGNFLDCCARAGYRVDRAGGAVAGPSHRTVVRCYPIPVDAAGLVAESASPAVLEWESRLDRAPARNIVRIERLDPAKNAIRGIQAFGLLLARRPELRGGLTLIACLVPSRPGVPEYRDYAAGVDAAVAAVESACPGSVKLYRGYDRQRALAALRVYDVLYVNPLRDGMNLVAQEGPVINGRDGVLVLSRGAGCTSLLGRDAVVLPEPRDVPATADALAAALAMPPPERHLRAARLRGRIAAGSPVRWLEDQLRELAGITGRRYP